MKRLRPSILLLSRKRLRKYLRRLRRLEKQRVRKRRRAIKDTGRPWPLGPHLDRWKSGGVAPREDPRTLVITIPADFSVSRNPEAVASVVRQVCDISSDTSIEGMFFDHSKLKQFELAAEAVLDVVVREVRGRSLRVGRRLSLGGQYPTDVAAQRFIRGIGLSRHLEIPNTSLPPSEEGKLRTFQQHKRTPTAKNAPAHTDEKSKVAENFADFVDDCLKHVSRSLSPMGRQRLCDYTGEIIDNIEQHGETNYWYIAGYLDTTLDPPICEIAVFNFGRTFAETFTALDPQSFPNVQVAPYIEKHRGSNWFGNEWTEENLYTLIALQGGISSKATSDSDNRGHGTTDLIRFFQALHTECGAGVFEPEMVLWSANTHILFDGRYKLRLGIDHRWTIAFNDANSLSERPDGKYVRHLTDVFFPGAMISIKFGLPASVTSATKMMGA